jgi:RimJ/RimL family protein N-acetyltransferase
VLREWSPEDLPAMAELLDEPEVTRWTPLDSPFDRAAAERYLDRAVQRRREGSALQLAVTRDGVVAGEVLLFRREDGFEVGWALGAKHRGQGLASGAVRTLTAWARPIWRIRTFRALIEPGNTASERVAGACGFVRQPHRALVVESEGRRTELASWELTIGEEDGVRPGSGRGSLRFGLE